jgi:hypothetical protein
VQSLSRIHWSVVAARQVWTGSRQTKPIVQSESAVQGGTQRPVLAAHVPPLAQSPTRVQTVSFVPQWPSGAQPKLVPQSAWLEQAPPPATQRPAVVSQTSPFPQCESAAHGILVRAWQAPLGPQD